MALHLIVYPILIFILATFVLITVPRDKLRILMPYGVVLGGLVDFVDDLIFGDLLKITFFDNMGIFEASGHLILAPIAWTLLIIFYLHYWPDNNRYLGYFYALAWVLLSTGFSQIVYAAQLFNYLDWFYPIPMFISFAIRFAIITWIALRFKVIRL